MPAMTRSGVRIAIGACLFVLVGSAIGVVCYRIAAWLAGLPEF